MANSNADGSSTYIGSARNQVVAPESIWPHDEVGGLTPTPRKDSPASAITLDGSSTAA